MLPRKKVYQSRFRIESNCNAIAEHCRDHQKFPPLKICPSVNTKEWRHPQTEHSPTQSVHQMKHSTNSYSDSSQYLIQQFENLSLCLHSVIQTIRAKGQNTNSANSYSANAQNLIQQFKHLLVMFSFGHAHMHIMPLLQTFLTVGIRLYTHNVTD